MSLRIFCYCVGGHDVPFLVRTRHGKWPGPGLAGPGCACARAGTMPAVPTARDSNSDTPLTSATDEVFPILIGNVWQSATTQSVLFMKAFQTGPSAWNCSSGPGTRQSELPAGLSKQSHNATSRRHETTERLPEINAYVGVQLAYQTVEGRSLDCQMFPINFGRLHLLQTFVVVSLFGGLDGCS